MRIVLLRHGKTRGNEEHRYVGRTDEGLTEASRRQILDSREEFWRSVLRQSLWTARAVRDVSAGAAADGLEGKSALCVPSALPDLTLLVSPLRRARETAALLCPGISQQTVADFREMDFGRFEYRNYEELMADPESAGIYQHFIDSGGTCGFPEGESRTAFSERVCRAYTDLLPGLLADRKEKTLLIVAHGGTLMALLERFGLPKRDYFDWQCGCLGGFSGELAADGRISDLLGFGKR